ncbi:hypothetical protein [Mycobacterium sp. M26]|uniref:Rv1733c family protein n=1 Tax=Mycobacterium sp. M26 TaxID=1762962 RepID=UPI00073EE00D|nr:hypothetical protein [Mycobacterium sp. M26]
MDTFLPRPGGDWFSRLFARNPLIRRSDRVESLILMLAVAVVLAAAPVAGAIGTAVHSSRSAVYQEQMRTRHTVTATVLEDSTSTVRPYAVSFDVHARWFDRGVTHEDTFGWDRPAKTGEQLTIWVDQKGGYVGPPTRPHRAVSDAVIAAVVLWLSVLTLVVAATTLVRFRIERRRHAQWDRGLRGLVGDGGGRTSSDH